ncbi:hypothetical protein F1C16_05110 [Hymenobacter sp. NBH84]|uniref:DUF6169 family protein n=1 Tax=Hymenobacter sp. NBH84 TaxID=2596915 RepID=UPI001624FF7B|nr:DUF6169 family protein [Hymenobacter sp. NBH84]QNE38975.1 hypothetical protein F1C16_05110 [Hymenobacter sp. NBH84]
MTTTLIRKSIKLMTSNLLKPIPYKIKDSENGKDYYFITDKGYRYNLYYTDAQGYFGDNPIGENSLTFGLELVGGELPRGIDPRIGATVAKFLAGTFNADTTLTILYVCDTKDEREFKRETRFDRWFKEYNDGSVVQRKIANKAKLPAYLFYHVNHPNPKAVDNAVLEITEKINQYLP